MSQIVNESTAVVQIDSSRLQNGNYATVYLSSTTIPGQLVTVMDATGFLSSPQTILLSTVGTRFSDGSYSTLLTQRYSYITLVSKDSVTWSDVGESPFPDPRAAASYKSLDTSALVSPVILSRGLVSSASLTSKSIDSDSVLYGNGVVLASTVYVNNYSTFISSSPIDYRFTVNGPEHIYGSTVVVGAGSFRESIVTQGSFFNTGNISSKFGTIYVGGDVTTASSIRGQRGNVIAVAALSSFNTARFVGPVSITSSVLSGNFVAANAISADTTNGISMNIASSVIFSPTQTLQTLPGYLLFSNLPITIPSTISSMNLMASNAMATSNLTLESFGPASTLSYMTLGSTQITNPAGSLSLSSLVGHSLTLSQLATREVKNNRTLTVNSVRMNDLSTLTSTSIDYPGGRIQIPLYWVISSLGTNGTLHAPYTTISTNTVIGKSLDATRLDTVNDNFTNFYTNTVTARSNVLFSNLNSISLRGVSMNNSGGGVITGQAETQSVVCSSIQVDYISSVSAIRFTGSNTFLLPASYISSLTAGVIVTSSLETSKITAGLPENYSTINPSTPWMLTSTFQMNTDPFTATTGLGTYFNDVTFIACGNQTAYYTLIDPSAQKPIYLSTPYVNTIAGTGISGPLSTTAQVASNSQIGFIGGQPASDSSHNLYIGANSAGWRLQRITPTGRITTLAGNNQFFYGDGQFPPQAALGPNLAISITAPGTLLITDISNSRIRYVTTDPIITTIAGTGGTSYTGDGGLALRATLSTPTTTATDSLGNIYIADTGSQVIRRIQNSTITTYGGNGQIGNTGDGGPATQARLNSPFGLAVDSANNLIFSDLSNCALRTITPAGVIQRLAGTYTRGFSGDGGPALSATMAFPRDVALDTANNIYFCDTGNARVRRIDALTGIIRTVAGNGVQGYGGDNGLAVLANLSSPTGVTTDVTGNLYISDTQNHCIRYVNMITSTITTVAGRPRIAGYGGDRSFATFALLSSPSHVAFDPTSGYYYIADDGNRRIRYVNSANRIIFTAAGNGSPLTGGDGGPAVNAVFGSITSVATDISQNIYVTDSLGNAIRKIDAVTSTITTVVGTGAPGFSGDGGPASAARISSPQTLVIDLSSNLYFSDTNNQRIRRVDASTNTISTLCGTGVAGYNGDFISSIGANLNFPRALTRDSVGTLYVGDSSNYRIRRIDNRGFITTYAGNGLNLSPTAGISFRINPIGIPTALTTDICGTLYMAESRTSALWSLPSSTGLMNPISAVSSAAYLGDASPLSRAYFNRPAGMIIDSCGNFLIADSGNYRLRRSYTFGNPLNPVYVNMNFNYTNYFTSTGTAYITLNGNLLTTFNGSSESNLSYTLTDANLLDYPLQTSNPVYGNQQPYIEITQVSTFGYSKLLGTLWLNQVPQQGLLQNAVDSNDGILVNNGTLVFPYQNNGITIENPYNDASLRSVNYTGSLISASDKALKENISEASLPVCYTTLASLPLRRYTYVEPYLSTFHTADHRRLGFLTSEVLPYFPNSISPIEFKQAWAPSTVHTLDVSQIKYNHFGVTKNLIELIESLEESISTLTPALRAARMAQRNNVL